MSLSPSTTPSKLVDPDHLCHRVLQPILLIVDLDNPREIDLVASEVQVEGR